MLGIAYLLWMQGGNDHGLDRVSNVDVSTPSTLQLVVYRGGEHQDSAPTNVSDDVHSPEYSTPPEETADGSPDQSPLQPAIGRGRKRVAYKSNKIRGDYTGVHPVVKGLFASREKTAYAPLQTLDKKVWKTFRSTLAKAKDRSFHIVSGQEVTNGFFLDIGKRSHWLNTSHMQVLTDLILRRRGEFLLNERAVFVDPWFTHYLVTGYPVFKRAEVKDRCDWSAAVERLVTGRGGRSGKILKSLFVKDVDRVYTPMNWGNTHWVGLVINLPLASIEIYDSYTTFAETDSEVAAYMEPVLQSLPWVLKRYLPAGVGDSISTAAYTWIRSDGLYQNIRSGDCGPCAMKFLEMHAAGIDVETMGQLTDKDVDSFRAIYAMDCYEEFIGNSDVANV